MELLPMEKLPPLYMLKQTLNETIRDLRVLYTRDEILEALECVESL